MWLAVLAFAGDREVASDAVAETFAQALRRGDAIREPERWLWRTVFRVAAGELKTRGREEHVLVEGSYEMEEPARELVAALARLSPRQRGAVVLHHAAGYPGREVAAILGSTPAAVKVHLMRGRRRLRELLGEPDADA
jgi:RNA polymerase sigma-70 factor (ECF subfamily)